MQLSHILNLLGNIFHADHRLGTVPTGLCGENSWVSFEWFLPARYHLHPTNSVKH